MNQAVQPQVRNIEIIIIIIRGWKFGIKEVQGLYCHVAIQRHAVHRLCFDI